MKKITKLSAFIISAAMLLSSCAGNTPAATTPTESTTAATTEATTTTAPEPVGPTEASYAPDKTNVKLIGRTHTENDVLWLAQSASGIEFTFKGTKASVDIKGDGAATGSDEDSQARFAVYINGERKLDEMINSAEKTYEIYSSDDSKDVTVKILKLSESTSSTFGISGLTVTSEDGISPTPEKDLKIEFIGDSITCGYGVDDEDRNHHFSTKTEDATRAYAYKVAEKLDADYSLVCYSGHGIISGYTSDSSVKETGNLVPPVYEHFAKSYGSANGYFDIDSDWDFSSFVPDYIVINLGTNDDSYVKGMQEKKDEFIEQYAEFLKTVRKNNPDSCIVCVLGTMGGNLYLSIEKAIKKYSEETGDGNVYAKYLQPQNGDANGLAADWHPTEKTHEEAATAVADFIKSIMDGSLADAA